MPDVSDPCLHRRIRTYGIENVTSVLFIVAISEYDHKEPDWVKYLLICV